MRDVERRSSTEKPSGLSFCIIFAEQYFSRCVEIQAKRGRDDPE